MTALYDAALSAEIGGYPKDAIVAAKIDGRAWRSLKDNNISDPEGGGQDWESVYVIELPS